MSWYEQHVVDRVIDFFIGTDAMGVERAHTLAPVTGDVLEVGPGTGNNFRHYPATTERITAVSREPQLHPRAQKKASSRQLRAEYVRGDAHALPFERARFDTVVTTFLLCSVRDPQAVVGECFRVLRPGGQLLFLEHVHDSGSVRGLVQKCLDPVNRVLLGNCCLTRSTEQTIRDAGFVIEEIRHYDVPSLPWSHRHAIRGRARAQHRSGALQ